MQASSPTNTRLSPHGFRPLQTSQRRSAFSGRLRAAVCDLMDFNALCYEGRTLSAAHKVMEQLMSKVIQPSLPAFPMASLLLTQVPVPLQVLFLT